MRFVETLKNIWTIQELRQRLLVTVLLVFIYRPGLLRGSSRHQPRRHRRTAELHQPQRPDAAARHVLGQRILPGVYFRPGYHAIHHRFDCDTALRNDSPLFQKLQREGESGRQKLNQYTRYLTVAILVLQAPAYLINLQVQASSANSAIHMGFWTVAYLTIILAAGSMFIMWLGERITDRGIATVSRS